MSTPEDAFSHWRSIITATFSGRDWLVAQPTLANCIGVAKSLREHGARRCMSIAGSPGSGDLTPEDGDPDPIALDLPARSMMKSLRLALDAFADLDPQSRARIDAFDPDGSAQAIGPIFDDSRPVAGRGKFGARAESWRALENKTIVDALWDAVGIPRAPARIVETSREALVEAHLQLDDGAGCVWCGDDRDGFNGGASALRWIRDLDAEADEAAGFLSANHAHARVMPFLEGVPCSIHGIVFPDTTIALRPCEMLVFRRPGSPRFHYGSASTFWDPRDEDRDAMRSSAVALGDHLRETLGYRGAFTLDGVMTRDGFLPTEINPRFGAALGKIAAGAKLDLMLLNLAIVEGVDADWRPRELEGTLLELADARENRRGGVMALCDVTIDETSRVELVRDDDGWRTARDGEEPHARATIGPGATGGFVFVGFTPEHTPVGPSTAPLAAEVLAHVDAAHELGIGELTPSRDVRPK